MNYPAVFFRVSCTRPQRMRALEDYSGHCMWYHIQPSNKIVVLIVHYHLSLALSTWRPLLPSSNLNASSDVFSSSTSVEVNTALLCAKHTLQDLALRTLHSTLIP